ncbi:MAG: PLP-dependent aspartate aminotransferase family protein [Myxococcota bacterium]
MAQPPDPDDARPLAPATRAARALGASDEAVGGVVPAIHPSTPYRRDRSGTYPGGHSYARDQSPSFDAPEALLADLEGGAEALLFASGMAAATTVFETLPNGAHVVIPEQMYWTVRGWLAHLESKGRLRVSRWPGTHPARLETLLQPDEPTLVWIETPSNPMTVVTDIAATVEVARRFGARTVADGTLATPALCQPLSLGVDWVMHSATKQLNGHADVLAGALVCATPDAAWEAVRYERGYRGAVLGPFEAWLLLRGMRTLYLRVRASCEGAQRVAEALQDHPALAEVLYPGLPEHPGHAIAARQMQGGFGPLVSLRLREGAAAARALPSRLRCFADASSLGGVESQVEYRAAVEGADSPVPDDLVRLSIGIEDPDDLVDDLRTALDGAA